MLNFERTHFLLKLELKFAQVRKFRFKFTHLTSSTNIETDVNCGVERVLLFNFDITENTEIMSLKAAMSHEPLHR